ncbi:MAG TPA: Lrp/AsnC family transcriptional regulator [Flavitalea sp.]|nr:Lrp/AsnC family transcriptional regulator [Flavitalea sp.]
MPMHQALDETDRRILQLLQQDARLTNKQIAERTGKSVTPVFERIKRLEREGYIQQYVAVLNSKMVGKGLIAFAHVQLRLHDHETMLKFEDTVIHFSEIMECYRMAGEYDYLLNIVVKDMEEFNEFVIRRLSLVYDISKVQTYFVIDEMKKSTVFNLIK